MTEFLYRFSLSLGILFWNFGCEVHFRYFEFTAFQVVWKTVFDWNFNLSWLRFKARRRRFLIFEIFNQKLLCSVLVEISIRCWIHSILGICGCISNYFKLNRISLKYWICQLTVEFWIIFVYDNEGIWKDYFHIIQAIERNYLTVRFGFIFPIDYVFVTIMYIKSSYISITEKCNFI